MKQIKDYVNAGVSSNKIQEIVMPSVTWSLSRKKVVSDNDAYELLPIKNEPGCFELSCRNNRLVNVMSYSELDERMVKQINDSEGILVYCNDSSMKNAMTKQNEKPKTKNRWSWLFDIFKTKVEPKAEEKPQTLADLNPNFRFQFIPSHEAPRRNFKKKPHNNKNNHNKQHAKRNGRDSKQPAQ